MIKTSFKIFIVIFTFITAGTSSFVHGASFIEDYTLYLVDLHEVATARRFLWLQQKDPEALHWIGMLHIEGMWGYKSRGNAFFLKAAQKGYAPSMCALGDSYFSGDGIERDFKKAFYWYKKAADQNFGPAYFHLAVLYRDGKGIKSSLRKAQIYSQKAAKALPHFKNYALQLFNTCKN